MGGALKTVSEVHLHNCWLALGFCDTLFLSESLPRKVVKIIMVAFTLKKNCFEDSVSEYKQNAYNGSSKYYLIFSVVQCLMPYFYS